MTDQEYMLLAIEEAKIGAREGEIPVGCVIVLNDEIIAKSHNQNRARDCNLYHAEIIAIEEACKNCGRWKIQEATMYVTLEPCLMCSGAIIQSRIRRLVYGTKEERFGNCDGSINAFELKTNHHVEITSGICKEEISEMMKKFFMDLRNKGELNG